MSTSQNVPLVQKTYHLYAATHEAVKRFPKTDRYTLGERIKSLLLEILELLIEAETAKRDWKEPALVKASRKLGLLKLLIRLAHETKALDNRSYLALAEELVAIGRMIGGWIKAVQ